MLVLSRRRGERIQIGDDVVVVVLDAKPGRIRLGIEAPGNVAIHRQEVLARPETESTLELAGCRE